MPILIKGSGGAQEAPVITVSSSGLITATAGDEKTTKQLSTQAAKTVTPGASEQTVVASGKYTTGAVTVEGVTLKSDRVAGYLDGSASVVLQNSAGGTSVSGSSKIFCVTGDAFGTTIDFIGTAYGYDESGNLSYCKVRYLLEDKNKTSTATLSLAVNGYESIVLSGEDLIKAYNWGVSELGVDVLYV